MDRSAASGSRIEWLRAAAFFACCTTGPAAAIAPATDEQLLCHATRLVEVQVLSGRGGGCFTVLNGRCLPGMVHLTVKIDRIVASVPHDPGAARVDPVIEGAQYEVAVSPSSPVRGLAQGAFVLPSDRAPSDEEVERAFRSSPLVLGLYGSAPGLSAHVWLRSDEPWILATLARAPYRPCPSVVDIAERRPPPASS